MDKFIFILTFFCLFPVFHFYSTETEKEKSGFEKYFDIYDTVRFELDSLIIGKISKILEIRENAYVILDEIAGRMWVVDVGNNNFKEIKLEKYLPGTELQVLNIFSDPENGFWFNNNISYFIHYDSLGNYLEHHSIEPYFIEMKSCICGHYIFSYRFDPEKGPLIYKYDINERKVVNIIKLDRYYKQELKNLIYRTEGGFLYSDYKGRLYIANALEYKIFKLNTRGDLIKEIPLMYKDFQEAEEDIENSKKALLRHISTMPNYGIICHGLHFSKTLFGVLSAINRSMHFEIVTLDGNFINQEKIILNKELIHGRDDLLYFVISGENYDENPYVIRYKLNGCLSK